MQPPGSGREIECTASGPADHAADIGELGHSLAIQIGQAGVDSHENGTARGGDGDAAKRPAISMT